MFFVSHASAQNPEANRANIWYFGNGAGLDFSSGSPVAITNGALHTWEGCASMRDLNGNLLMYTNGNTGLTATDGFEFGIDNFGIGIIRQFEPQPICFYIDGKIQLQLNNTGTLQIPSLASNNNFVITDEQGNLCTYNTDELFSRIKLLEQQMLVLLNQVEELKKQL